MDAKLVHFLKPFKLTPGNQAQYTHISLLNPQERYSIQDEFLADFYTFICQLVADGGSHCLAEAVPDRIPLIVNVNLLYPDESPPDQPYSTRFVEAVIKAYQDAIEESLTVSEENPMELICFCCEHEAGDDGIDYLEVNSIVNGQSKISRSYRFKLYFPYCRTRRSIFVDTIQPNVMNKMRQQKCLDYLEQHPENTWEQILRILGDEPIMMYGGALKTNDFPLTLTKCYQAIDHQTFIQNEILPENNTEDFINMYMAEAVGKGLVTDEFFDFVYGNDNLIKDVTPEHWLPLFFSSSFCRQFAMARNEAIRQRPMTMDTFRSGLDPDQDRLTTLTELFDIMQNTNDAYMAKYHQCRFVDNWLDIGRACYTAGKGKYDIQSCSQALELWKGVCNPYNPNRHDVEYNDYWDEFYQYGTNNITDATIRYYIMTDCTNLRINDYKTWRQRYCVEKYIEATSLIDDDIASAFHFRFFCNFIFCGKTWYKFIDHRWVEDPAGNSITSTFVTEFRTEIMSVRQQLETELDRMAPAERPQREKDIKGLNVLEKKLKTGTMQKKIVTYLQRIYSKPEFDDICDENRRLTVCRNGILEIVDDRVILRPGKPEDFCTKSTKVLYPLTPPVKLLEEIEEYWKKLFGPKCKENTLRTWVERWIASYLIGGNEQKLMPFFYGPSHTSKSIFAKYINAALGEYFVKGNKNAITYNPIKASENGPSPGVVRKKGVRSVIYDEMDGKTMLDGGALRQDSGGDTREGRDLFGGSKTMRDFTQQYKSCGICNRLPRQNDPSVDATWERMAVIPFKSLFLFPGNPRLPNTEEEQFNQRIFTRDPRVEERVSKWAAGILWLMVHTYPEYAKYGMPKCEIIEYETERYRSSCDLYVDFCKYALSRTNDNTGTTVKDMYNHYKHWFISKVPSSRPPSESDFLSEMAMKSFVPIGGRFMGVGLCADMRTED